MKIKIRFCLLIASILCYGFRVHVKAAEAGAGAGSTTYYVANAGDDGHAGTGMERPWRTVSKVNEYGMDTGFKPGDRICFKAGDRFDDAVLRIVNSGAEHRPIVFTSYGRGRAHLTLKGTRHTEIIRMNDQRYVTIENLEISNPDFDISKTPRAIAIELTRDGAYPGITLRDNYIHDIHGGMWRGRHLRGGIWMRSRSNTAHAYTENLLVENNTIERCHTRGIKLDGQGKAFHQNVVVRNNDVNDTGQAGILIGRVDGGLIEGNTVYRAGNYEPEGDRAGVLAACWAAHSRNIIIQGNEVAYTKLGDVHRPDGNLNEQSHDSQAFDIDVTAPGRHILQYNYTHDNEGGFFLWMGRPGPDFEWAVIRYNLSVNDGKGFDNRLFELHSHKDSNTYPVYVYNNTFVNDERIWVNNRSPKDDDHRGWIFENNIFYAPQGQYDDQTTIVYRNNLYWPGRGPSNDEKSLHADPRLLEPGFYGDGWRMTDGYRLRWDSPAVGEAIVEASRGLIDVGKRDFYGDPLPRQRRTLGAHEPQGRSTLGSGKSHSFKAVRNENGILITEYNKNVLFYRTKAPTLRNSRAHYIHPLYGLNGQVLTEDAPADHVHHHGIYWAWHQVVVNGKVVGNAWACRDFIWDVKDVWTQVVGNRMVLQATVLWRSPDMRDTKGAPVPFVRETCTITVHAREKDRRQIDIEFQLTALQDSVQIGGATNEKGYGGFSARLQLPQDVVFTAGAEEVTPKSTAVAAGPEMTMTGTFDDFERSSIMIRCDTDLPTYTQNWILRKEGSMQNAVFPGRELLQLPKTEPLKFKYSIVLWHP